MITLGSLHSLVLPTVLVLATVTPTASTDDDNSVWQDILKGAPPIQYSSLSGPAFVNTTEASARAVAGSTAMLPCGIRNLHNYTVSWVRGSDIRLLTSKDVTYTSDSRFVAINPGGGQRWVLKIHYVRKSDGGSYLCQVSTTPPMSYTVNLTVHEAVVTVEPGTEVYVQTGSRLEVVCQVQGCPAPAFLAWSLGRQAVLTPEPNTFTVTDNNLTTPVTRLSLSRPHAAPSHTGTYTCTSACTRPINVTVHVLKGEELAAMQHHNNTSHLSPSSSFVACTLVASVTLILLTRSLLTGGHNLLLQPHREALLHLTSRLHRHPAAAPVT